MPGIMDASSSKIYNSKQILRTWGKVLASQRRQGSAIGVDQLTLKKKALVHHRTPSILRLKPDFLKHIFHLVKKNWWRFPMDAHCHLCFIFQNILRKLDSVDMGESFGLLKKAGVRHQSWPTSVNTDFFLYFSPGFLNSILDSALPAWLPICDWLFSSLQFNLEIYKFETSKLETFNFEIS